MTCRVPQQPAAARRRSPETSIAALRPTLRPADDLFAAALQRVRTPLVFWQLHKSSEALRVYKINTDRQQDWNRKGFHVSSCEHYGIRRRVPMLLLMWRQWAIANRGAAAVARLAHAPQHLCESGADSLVSKDKRLPP